MKILNVEDGEEKIYVQMGDLEILKSIDISVPVSIVQDFFIKDIIVDDSNKENFVEFTKPDEIEFFNSLEWLVDYKRVRYLSLDDIKNMIYAIRDEVHSLVNDRDINDQTVIQVCKILEYKAETLAKILMVKQGKKQLPFPVVPDSDGFSLLDDLSFVANPGEGEYVEYEMGASLDPNKVLLFRTDKKQLSLDDSIPRGFLEMGISILLMERCHENFVVGEYETSNSLTVDNKYYVTEFKFKPYDNSRDEIIEQNSVKRLLRRFFK